MKVVVRVGVPAIVAAVTTAACGSGNVASSLVKAPDYQPQGESQCSVGKSQSRPLIVEWSSSDRLELETKTRESVVVVRYSGCVMDVLERCSVPARYRYLGGTRKQDRLVIRNADDLYANLPVGAAKLEGKLQRSGQLTVDMDLVGRYEADTLDVKASDLQGDCAGATHFVYGVTVGAFDFFAGGAAEVGGSAGIANVGAGARSSAEKETLSRDGDVASCDKAQPDDKGPPPQCGALVRVEVVPLGGPPNPFVGQWTCNDTVTVASGQTVRATAETVITDNGDGTVTAATRAPGHDESCSTRLTVTGNRATLTAEQTCTVGGRTATAKSIECTAADAASHTCTGVAAMPVVGDVRVVSSCVRR
jgi:hypothetical protein